MKVKMNLDEQGYLKTITMEFGASSFLTISQALMYVSENKDVHPKIKREARLLHDEMLNDVLLAIGETEKVKK